MPGEQPNSSAVSQSGTGGGGTGNAPGYLIQTGLSDSAAQQALQAQLAGISGAKSAYSNATNTAIQQLMNQYGSSFNLATPQLQNSGMAGAQLNYMLGLPSMQMPTAPTQSGLAQAMTKSANGINITGANQQAIQQYINQNVQQQANGSYVYKPTGTVAGSAADLLNNANVLNNATYNTQTVNYDPTQKQISDYINANSTGDPASAMYTYNPTGSKAYSIADDTYKDWADASGGTLNNRLDALPDVMTNATEAVKKQLQQQYGQYNSQLANYGQSQDGLAYNQAVNQFNEQMPAAAYSQSLGQASPNAINNIVSNLPGYQAQFAQGIGAIQNASSAKGLLSSGNMMTELQNFGQNMESQYYNNYVGQLANQVQSGMGLLQQQTQGQQDLGNSLASLQTNLGTNLANASLASGQATANSYTSPLSAYQNQYVPTIPQYGSSMNVYGGSGGGSGGASWGDVGVGVAANGLGLLGALL